MEQVLSNRFSQMRFAICLVLSWTLSGTAVAQDSVATVEKSDSAVAVEKAQRAWMDASLPEEERVDLLLKAMNEHEKIQQLDQLFIGKDANKNNEVMNAEKLEGEVPGSYLFAGQSPELRNKLQRQAVEETRLGIPIIFGYDIIHGCKVIFPMPLGLSFSFNPALAEEGSSIAAIESARAGIDWTFAPMVDVSRDPRWGRIAESYGEDPYVASRFSEASVWGFQGRSKDDLKSDKHIAACLKHFVAYGASESGRDYHSTAISNDDLFNTYLPPFKAGVDAGAATLMSGFNDLNGIPTSANHYIETEILRDRWGFDGFVVSDWESVTQLRNQGFARDARQCAELSLNAGTDMDMVSHAYTKHLAGLLEDGSVTQETLDTAVKRILRIKFRLGLFERPYVEVLPLEERFYAPEHLESARLAAHESVVLLKNEEKTLPVDSKEIKTIAIIGPAADDPRSLLGPWMAWGESDRTDTFLTAVKKRFGENVEVIYEKGTDLRKEGDDVDKEILDRVAELAAKADLTILCVGEDGAHSSENHSIAKLELKGGQKKLLQAVRGKAKKLVTLFFACRPFLIEDYVNDSHAFVLAGYPGSEGGNALIDVITGDVSPSGKLTCAFPRHTGQIPIHYNRRNSGRTRGRGDYKDISG